MAQHVRLGDVFRFGVTVHNPSGGAIINADETPRWFVYEEANDTPILAGDFTLRTGHIGRYRATFNTTTGNGFDTQSYYEVHASGKVNGIVGWDIISSFVVDDVYNSNLIQYNSGVVDNLVTDITGPIDTLISTQSNDFLVPIRDALISYQGGSVSDATPNAREFTTNLANFDNYWNGHIIVMGAGSTVEGQARIISRYYNTGGLIQLAEPFSASPADGDGFTILTLNQYSSYYLASGVLANIATIAEVASGVWTQDPASFNTGFGAQLQPLYFADVKQYYDLANNRDEYDVQWFNGGIHVTSGQLTNPALSVYNTTTGAAVLANKTLTYASTQLGAVRYNSSAAEVLASGEPYLAVVSGTIGGATRTFMKVIGRHNL